MVQADVAKKTETNKPFRTMWMKVWNFHSIESKMGGHWRILVGGYI